jgi:hypothetical protein
MPLRSIADRFPTGRAFTGALAGVLALAGVAAAGLPPEDQCPLLAGTPGGATAEDAAPVRLREGMVLEMADLLLLRTLLPEEIWRHREAFFHEGMRMEIGRCHHRYPTPEFFSRATEAFAGRATLDDRGNLRGYVAGLPFPPETIDPGASDAGARWAWNLEHRYRGAGHVGEFRIVDMARRSSRIQRYRGSFFLVQTSHRADLPESGYALPEADESLWIAGGRFQEPFSARHLAWRQRRPLKAHERYSQPDDTFVYVPTMRKTRRSATSWVDGLFTPRYRVSGDSGGGSMGVGDPMGSATGSFSPTAAESIAASEHLERGFAGLALRPNAYVWRVREEREVLAPLNGAREGYPLYPNRNFGPSGLSVGDDRWDARYAVVIQGAAYDRSGNIDTITLYVDYQTQQPLYLIRKRGKGRLVDVGVLVHRFSGDLPRYPLWPSGEKAFVFDPVLASFHVATDDSGWRRESYELLSTPIDSSDLRRFMSADFLARGR